MPELASRLDIPPDSSTASGRRWWRRSDRPIPEDLARQASRRLGFMSILAATLWIVATVAYHLVDRVVSAGETAWLAWRPSDGITVVAVAVSFGLFFYTRRTNQDPRRVLDLGLLYMVLMSLGVGLIWHWEPTERASIAPAITWVGAIVLMFAAIVPSPPGRMLAAGLVAASMNPVGMLVARARGTWDFGPAHGAWVMHYPDYLLAVVSAVIAHVVYQLGQQVAKAREMGSYQLGELIGRGGMGEVYRATHRMLARPAAVKLIRPEALGGHERESRAMAVRRFRREAETAASLRSPHTVELYDFGVTADGTLYFAMELLDGLDLETLVRKDGPLPAGRVAHILRQACASLEEAHARGLVHRDIKPANIHLGRLGLEYDFVKVLDFGLVRSIASDGRQATFATAAGIIPGTPAYMAPEMAIGDTVDGRADLYSLGCVAYYLLSGRLVFEGTSGMQMLMRRLQEEPPPLSSRTEIAVPPELERLVHACLAKSPTDRPASARALADALASSGVPPWTEDDARAWWMAHRPAAPAPGVVGDATRTALMKADVTRLSP
jgi:serine/threonine-protein kinase